MLSKIWGQARPAPAAVPAATPIIAQTLVAQARNAHQRHLKMKQSHHYLLLKIRYNHRSIAKIDFQ